MKKGFLALSLFASNMYAVTWNDAQCIKSGGIQMEHPCASIDAAGNRKIVWKEKQNIQAVEGTDTFSEPKELYSGPSYGELDLVSNSKGEAVLYFTGIESKKPVIKVCEYSKGNWAKVATLSDVEKQSNKPCFTMLENGDVTGVWVERDKGGNKIISTCRNKGKWNQSDVCSELSKYHNPQVAMSSVQNGVALWANRSENYFQIFCSKGDDGWNEPCRISTLFHTVWHPSVSMNKSEFGVGVWTELLERSWNVHAAIYSDGEWSEPALISVEGANDQNCKVAVNDNNFAICVWERRIKGKVCIFGSQFQEGEWSEPQAIYEGQIEAKNPNVVINNNNQAVVSWICKERKNKHKDDKEKREYRRVNASQVYASTFDGQWSEPKLLSLDESEGKKRLRKQNSVSYSDPKMCINDKGQAVIVWSSNSFGGKESCSVYMAEASF